MMVITDPDDPSISDLSKENSYDLSRGLRKYILNETLAKEISYQPVTVTMDISLFKKYDNITPIISGALDIVKTFTEKLLDFEVINVEYVRIGDIITFTPITIANDEKIAIYENPEHLTEYYRVLNFDYLGGYQVLSDDPLVRYVLHLFQDQEHKNINDIDVVYVMGVALVPVGTNDNETNYYSNIVDTVDISVNSRKKQGYFAHVVSVYSLEEYELVKELASMWDTQLVFTQDNVITLQTEVNFGITAESWFRYNINLIRYGQLPMVTLFGSWQFQSQNQWYKSKILYAGLLAYQQLNDEFLEVFTTQIRVNDDFSLTLHIPTYEHLTLFRKNFDEILRNGNWYMEPCDGLNDGFIKRYYVQTVDNKAMPMVLSEGNDEVLVFRSPALTEYPSPLDFDKVDLTSLKEQLYPNLRNIEEWGLRGLYDVIVNSYVVKGLHRKVPRKILVPPNSGKIVITNDGKKYTVEVELSNDGKIRFLFETTENLNRELLHDLWSKGFFLNYWTSAYLRYRKPTSFMVIISQNIGKDIKMITQLDK